MFLKSSPPPIIWARWCLPTFNKHCDQLLKGSFADGDNSFCDSLIKKYKKKNDDISPWEHPTFVTFADSYGF